jgi:ATP-dependent Clp protease adapter protein ClpS
METTRPVTMNALFSFAMAVTLLAFSSVQGFTASHPPRWAITTGSLVVRPSLSSAVFSVVGAKRSTTVSLQAGPAVAEPPAEVVEEVTTKKDAKEQSASYTKKGGWAVRLFNDPMNKREFVSMCLSKICGLSDGQSYQVMMAAHQNGVAVIGRYDYERAELYRDSLVEQGLVCDMIPVEED